ncbi:hypothetical protein GF356_13505 [candidate division GN15 bacterium]|nr:hypothetical protein [candidate division GN15 bacterium]
MGMSTPPKIEKITIQSDTARITLSTNRQSYLIESTLAEQWGLKQGVVLTNSQVQAIETEAARLACRRQAANYLASRDYSEKELAVRLRKKGHQKEHIDEIIAIFRNQGILDDARVATNLARGLLRRKPCWRGYMLSHLQTKGIDRATAEMATESALTGHDETELACRALRSRLREYSQIGLETAQRKAYNYLSRRGFGYQAAREAWEILSAPSDKNEDADH